MGITFSSLALCQEGFALSDTLSQNDGAYLSPFPYLGTGLVSLSKELASYVVFILNILSWILKSFQTLVKKKSLLFTGLSGSFSSQCVDSGPALEVTSVLKACGWSPAMTLGQHPSRHHHSNFIHFPRAELFLHRPLISICEMPERIISREAEKWLDSIITGKSWILERGEQNSDVIRASVTSSFSFIFKISPSCGSLQLQQARQYSRGFWQQWESR